MSRINLSGQSNAPDLSVDAGGELLHNADGTPFQHRIIDLPNPALEQGWSWASERINPIVVKEIRQSLKSKQFTVSFGLTLIAAVGWTLVAISLMVPRIFYMPAGGQLLSGYFCILVAPLMVIIPLVAFLSITAETEDGTFELLSISALSSLQIVYGKMASGCVQILLYLSALAPCIVLTYLLRGVGLTTILFCLGWTVAFSIGETAVGILLGAIARTLRMLQVIAAVVLLGALFTAAGTWLGVVLSGPLIGGSVGTEEAVVSLGIVSVLAVAVSLVLRASAAAIDFPSENHSTPLRWRLLWLIMIILFWSALGLVAVADLTFSRFMLLVAFVLLLVIGALVSGERGVISPRAQRGLPRTFAGRLLFTWFYPGAGLGYVFLVCLFSAFVMTLAAIELIYEGQLRNSTSTSSAACGYVLLCFLAFYTGLNRLLMLAVPRQQPARMVAAVAMMAAVLALSHLLPLFLIYYANDYREFNYGWHQTFNIVWTLDEIANTNTLALGSNIILLTLCAIGVFGLNLVLCTRDVMLIRVALPPRVREDEQASQPEAKHPLDPFAPQQ